MKLRFLAAAGPAGARQQLARRLAQGRRETLIEVHCAGPMSLWVEAGTPLLKNGTDTAVAVGLLFDRSAAKRLKALPEWQSLERICIRDFWGSYVLFTTGGTSHSVLRDPSGAVPVYYGAAGALQVYASDADMLRLAWPEPFRPDLDAARHWLRFPFMRTARTGALGVTELLPGVMREAGIEAERLRPMWLPQSVAAPATTITSFADAASLLREGVLHSVRLLAEDQSKLVLQLSGGLDSSIVAAALAESGIKYRATTFATRSPDGDERRYAREVARHFDVELDELSEADLDLSVRIASGPFQRPPCPLVQALRRAQFDAVGPDSLLLDGGGGDNVFGSINSASPVIDAVRHCGLAEGIRTARNIAVRHGCTFWAAAASALRRARRTRMVQWTCDDSFLMPPAAAQTPDPHPWLASLSDMLPGSADHLRMIVGIHHFLIDPGPGQPCQLHPLICQPIVETCLRTGSWLWFEEGRDRAVARAAFRTMLPETIIGRRGKGSLQGMFVRGFNAMRPELRDYLLSGRLAEEGIIDAGAVAEYFDRADQRNENCVRILEIASAEQWLRSFD